MKTVSTLDYDTFSAKSFMRARLKENFVELTNLIFEAIDTHGAITTQTFPNYIDYHADYFIEYHETLKANYIASSPLNFKRRMSSIFVTYNDKYYKVTYGITSRGAIRMDKQNAQQIRSHEKIYDIGALAHAVQLS